MQCLSTSWMSCINMYSFWKSIKSSAIDYFKSHLLAHHSMNEGESATDLWVIINDDNNFSKTAQNSLPWVLPDKYITDRLTIQLILSLLTLFSLFLPSMNKSLFEKSNVLLSLMTNNSSMNRIPISNSTYVQISCAKYIRLLCWIWPDFIQKSSLFYQQSLGMIQTRVPISQFSLMTRSELQFS